MDCPKPPQSEPDSALSLWRLPDHHVIIRVHVVVNFHLPSLDQFRTCADLTRISAIFVALCSPKGSRQTARPNEQSNGFRTIGMSFIRLLAALSSARALQLPLKTNKPVNSIP